MNASRGKPNGQLFCVGYILYQDVLGRKMQTGFCRRYDAETAVWLRVENSDYEYSY